MKELIEKIKKLNEDELKQLMKIITEQQNKLEIEKLIRQYVPDIFSDKIISLSFNTNYDYNNSYGDYKEINNYGWCKFNNDLTITTTYKISNGCFGKSIKLQLKQGKMKTDCVYDYKEQDKRSNTIILLLDEKLLEILDVLKLKRNLYNKKMLGVLIHNILFKTEIACDIDEECDYDTNAIIIDNINEFNDKKSLYNDKYIIYNDNKCIRFKYVEKLIKNY
ncbi:hypothetical protein QLL95_gp1293 [Cotonvirus japonicus]|uniref:Uncharacterized protein n=1 Tax=Cotonvirus japonicus TaxID=2811091 RepID=A0ABM7NRP9_9VIRU|nr:hypothetical protein QLL95_gp1293 [Cotonvirus japonicus]BCS82830.1 hypothetical protein [Cotonvirus japonicus]